MFRNKEKGNPLAYIHVYAYTHTHTHTHTQLSLDISIFHRQMIGLIDKMISELNGTRTGKGRRNHFFVSTMLGTFYAFISLNLII